MDSHVNAVFNQGLTKGVYVALFQADWQSTTAHPDRKLVLSVNCTEPVSQMQRINLDDYDKSHIATFNTALEELIAKNIVQQPADDKKY